MHTLKEEKLEDISIEGKTLQDFINSLEQAPDEGSLRMMEIAYEMGKKIGCLEYKQNMILSIPSMEEDKDDGGYTIGIEMSPWLLCKEDGHLDSVKCFSLVSAIMNRIISLFADTKEKAEYLKLAIIKYLIATA